MIKQDDNLSQRFIMILVTIYRLYQIQKYTEQQQYTSRHYTNIWLEGPNATKNGRCEGKTSEVSSASASHCPATFNTTSGRKHPEYSSYFKIFSVPQAIHCQLQGNW
jgi:hypothetical protein